MTWQVWSSFFSHFRGIGRPRDRLLSRVCAGALLLPVTFAAANPALPATIPDSSPGSANPTAPARFSLSGTSTSATKIAADKTVSSGLKMDGYDSDDWEYTLSGDTLERPQTSNGKNSLSQDHDQETTASSC
jgi:hypothetical protein